MEVKGSFTKEYIKRMTDIIMSINPNFTKDDVKNTIKDMIEEKGQNPEVFVDNNYTGVSRDTTLLSVMDWWLDNDDKIITGNMAFYNNQYNAKNPNAHMLDKLLKKRKAIKKNMWKYIKTDPKKYAAEDRSQGNTKRLANSYYGGSGAPTSAFYSKYSGPSTTCTAQMVISTAENLFEGFIADNYQFMDLTELCEWLTYVKDHYEDNPLDDWIINVKKSELKERLLGKIVYNDSNDEEIISNIVDNMDDDFCTFVYYKNNIFEFISRHKYVQDIIYDIFTTVKNLEYISEDDPEWRDKVSDELLEKIDSVSSYNKFVNKTYFMDPNEPPDDILPLLDELKDITMKYIYTPYLGFDRIYRLKNFKRKTVTVIDTDSNILSLDTIVNFIIDNVIGNESFGRSNENNVFILINSLTYLLTNAITEHLLLYGKFSNIPEEFRPLYNMKNEFYFIILVIGKAKKRYISKMRLREGNLLDPPKSDVKGFDFKKATCSEYAEHRFSSIVDKYILGDEIDIPMLLLSLTEFKDDIIKSVKNGDKRFLPNGNAKELDAYKNPYTQQSIRGAITWNYLYPDNQIEFPSKVALLKLNIFTEEDILPLKNTHPDIYNTIIDKIFHDKDGIFITSKETVNVISYVNVKDPLWYKKIPKKWMTKYKKLGPEKWNEFVDIVEKDPDNPKYKVGDGIEINNKGMQIIAIPNDTDTKIPEWLDPYIDYTTLVNNILAPFKSVWELFGIRSIEEGRAHKGVDRKTKGYSTIINF